MTSIYRPPVRPCDVCGVRHGGDLDTCALCRHPESDNAKEWRVMKGLKEMREQERRWHRYALKRVPAGPPWFWR
jgi:hypothetical protein